MSRHKLYKSQSYSPFILSSDEENSSENAKDLASTSTKTPDQVEKKQNFLINIQRTYQVRPAETPAKTQNHNKNVSNLKESFQDSDSEFTEMDFFCLYNRKLPYTMEEDEFILKHVLKGRNIFKVSSILLWKHLELLKTNPKRTYQSLKNRFWKNIKPVIFTRYGHLIKNKETKSMILLKFPELKKQMKIGETLLKIQIPIRTRHEKVLKSATCNVTPITRKDKPEEPKRFSPPKYFESSPVFNQPSQAAAASTSGSPKIMNFYRKVKVIENSIKVLVNFNYENSVSDNTSASLLLNERFKKTKLDVGPFVCPFCRRGSRRSEMDETSGSETDGESVIPNSLETAEGNYNKKCLSNLLVSKNKIKPNFSIVSQSLLTCEEDKDSGERVPTSQIGGIKSRKCNGEESGKSIEKDNQRVTRGISPKKFSRAASSSQKSNSEPEKDQDSDIELIYENAMACFQKLISADEEKQLLKKCLYKNRDMIGFDFDSEKNLDSYFLESTPDENTPSLTNSYSTAQTTNESTAERESQQKDDSPIASYMVTRKISKESSNKTKS